MRRTSPDPVWGEASESQKRLSHPSPSWERGGQSRSPEPPKRRCQPARRRSRALLTGFVGAVVSRRSAEGSWRGGQAGRADPVPHPGDSSWPYSCLEGALPSHPGDSRVTSWPPLGPGLPAVSVDVGASSWACSLGCWQLAALGQARRGGTCFRRRPTQGRHRQVVWAWHGMAPRGSHPAPGAGGSSWDPAQHLSLSAARRR